MAKQHQVVGYIDQDGFTYCLKHGNVGMESIFNGTQEALDECKVCGRWLQDDNTK